MAILGVGWF